MRLYSDFPLARTAQLTADAIALAAIVISIVLGVAVGGLIAGFADFGRQVETVGTDLERTMSDAADTLGDVPLVGDGIRSPFDTASDAGGSLAEAGREQQEAVGRGALVAGLLVALVPVAVIARYWLTRRVRFARRAAEAARLAAAPGGLDLLALRALAARRPAELLAVDPDPTGAWRRADPAAVRALAALTLREAGVRPAAEGLRR